MTDTTTAAAETPTGQALARRDNSPRALVAEYRQSFTAVLPSHIQKPETWIRLAQGALKKGKRQPDGRTDLEVAAANNPAAFLASLLDCARLGLEPGTEQYYLTPRKVKGKTEILGIVGYQGLIELMYRAGAISSVVAECVYSNDVFRFRPGLDDIPMHEIDWDAPERGQLRLVYAFARMKDGATSKVVVLNRAAIDVIKKSSAGADWDSSPWKTNEPAMWLKSAVRQLAKWVPTSSEYIREQLRAARDVASEQQTDDQVDVSFQAPQIDPGADRSIGDIIDAEVIDGDDEPGDGGGAEPSDGTVVDPADEDPEERKRAQRALMAQTRKAFPDDPNDQRDAKRHAIAYVALNGRRVSSNDMTAEELRKTALMLRDVEEGRVTITAGEADGWTVQFGDNVVEVPTAAGAA